MTTAALIISLLIMLAGLLGTVLPMLPSIPMVYAGYAIYGLASDWQHYGLGVMVAFGLVTAGVLILDYLAGAIGAKRYGATPWGAWGSILGAFIGAIFFNVIGLVVGTFAGAFAGELIKGRTFTDAVRSGWGAILGFLAGSLFKIMVATMMIGVFLWLIIF